MASNSAGGRRRPPTSADVARHAGVSRATVSYVLNAIPDSGISEPTIARVHASARELGYIPHVLARSLRSGTSKLVLIPEFQVPPGPSVDAFFGEMRASLTRRGYTVVTHGHRATRGLAAARAWAELRPVGIIVGTKRLTRAGVELLRSTGTVAILGLGWAPSDLVPTLVQDHAGVGACAVEYLVSRGHRRIAVVVPSDPALRSLGLERLAGCARVAARHSITVEPVDLGYDEAEADALAVLWRKGEPPSAVFAYNDEYAMLLMRAMADGGLAVPADMAVVGADDLPLCQLLRPRLTSVRVEVRGSARVVAETLHTMIQHSDRLPVTGARLFTSSIVPRESA